MDSTNTASTQSSTGGDFDDYNFPSHPPPTSHHHPPPSSMYDFLPTYYLDSFPPGISTSTSPNPPLIAAPSSSPVQPPPTTPRGSKKRPRASRRAPTTVLTTDTSNFRAMVQEFTGFPSPPFSSSSPFPRPRIEVSNPFYLSRPLAQKVSSSPFPSPSIVDAIASAAKTSISTANTSACTTSSSTLNYQFPPNLNNIQYPILTSQFGDLGSLIASEGMHESGRTDGLSRWASEHESEGWDRDRSSTVEFNHPGSRSSTVEFNHPGSVVRPEFPPEKRSKSLQAASGEGVVESWIHSSD